MSDRFDEMAKNLLKPCVYIDAWGHQAIEGDYEGCVKEIALAPRQVAEDERKKAEKLVEALEFCLGREVFGQGICEADKPTEAYLKAKEALAAWKGEKG